MTLSHKASGLVRLVKELQRHPNAEKFLEPHPYKFSVLPKKPIIDLRETLSKHRIFPDSPLSGMDKDFIELLIKVDTMATELMTQNGTYGGVFNELEQSEFRFMKARDVGLGDGFYIPSPMGDRDIFIAP